MEVMVELFQILKDEVGKAVIIPANLENSAVATGLETVSFHSNPKEGQSQIKVKVNPKECSNHHTIALISYAGKVTFKILQAWLQEYVNQELPDV